MVDVSSHSRRADCAAALYADAKAVERRATRSFADATFESRKPQGSNRATLSIEWLRITSRLLKVMAFCLDRIGFSSRPNRQKSEPSLLSCGALTSDDAALRTLPPDVVEVARDSMELCERAQELQDRHEENPVHTLHRRLDGALSDSHAAQT